MHLHFLGTSAGCPSIERNVTSLALLPEGRPEWYMVDCGEGTQQQLLRSPLALPRLSKIFITHLHGDHCYGLPGLLSSRALMQAKTPLEIYGPKGLKPMLEAVFKYSYMRPAYELKITEFSEGQVLYDNEQESLEVIRLSHDVPSYAFFLQEKDWPGHFDSQKAKDCDIPPGPIYGQLKNGEEVTLEDGRTFSGADFLSPPTPGRKIIISGDNDSPHLLAPALESADLWIHEATHTEEAAASLSFRSRHSTAASVSKEAQKHQLKNLILTHFSPRFSIKEYEGRNSMKDIESEASEHFEEALHFARDFDQYHLSRDKKLTCEYRRQFGKKTKSK